MKPYSVFGPEHIEQGATTQMENVMSLDPVVKGALMPDAHQGYGMPIGGVCAVENAVIPYAVGVDIGCRMQMTILPKVENFKNKCGPLYSRLKQSLKDVTYFGGYARPKKPHDHPIMSDPRWYLVDKLGIKTHDGESLKDKAHRQLGTSGSGNHFVEWGNIKPDGSTLPPLVTEDSLALMSHSGSRALGYAIANHFTKLAASINPLPEPLNELSWLSMETEEGQLYFALMELCGDYSAANHDCIHEQVIEDAVGSIAGLVISNHHNFAWREMVDGKQLYVHRKGATPAGHGVFGIIPSSMATPAHIVIGKGSEDSINSASHGSGRAMSRSKAYKNITPIQRDRMLEDNGVELLGGGIDEAPQAYKDISKVMAAQSDLVHTVATFKPHIVRMAGKVEEDKSEGS